MTTMGLIRSKITGEPVLRRENDAVRLEGFYPNTEKGTRFFAAATFVALLTLISAPALYYGAAAPQSLAELPGAIIGGMPSALAPLVELARTWTPDETPPDLRGWSFGLGMAFAVTMLGAVTAHAFRTLTDRPYLAIEAQDETLSIQRGQFCTPVVYPRDQCRAVHVGRRKSGTYEVLLQHGDALAEIAVVDGNERRALLLKAKIDAMLAQQTGEVGHDRS